MKKYLPLIFIIFFIIIYSTGLNSNKKINWPHFIRLNNRFYSNKILYIFPNKYAKILYNYQ